MNILIKYCFILFIAAIGIFGQILLKKEMGNFSNLKFDSFLSKILTIVFEPLILVALSCYVIGIVAYLFLLSKFEITSIYPIYSSIVFGGITFFGWFILKEPLSWPKILGIALILIGIFLIDRFG